MEFREYAVDILLTTILLISTLFLALRFWQDRLIAIAMAAMILSLWGLLLSLHMRMRALEQDAVARERTLRASLEEISSRMVRKYDMALTHLDELNAEFSRRAYR